MKSVKLEVGPILESDPTETDSEPAQIWKRSKITLQNWTIDNHYCELYKTEQYEAWYWSPWLMVGRS